MTEKFTIGWKDRGHGHIGPYAVLNDAGEPVAEQIRDQATALLLAAAPEMFEALKWFIDDIDGTRTVMLDFDANVLRARTALQKAQGDEQ